jgi:hypothetical protein
MNGPSKVSIGLPITSATAPRADRLTSLIARLPPRIGRATAKLLHPQMRWARIPVGILLVIGGIFSILPVLGIWMLPLGLILLAEDVPVLRRWRELGLDWIERRRPHWIHGNQ